MPFQIDRNRFKYIILTIILLLAEILIALFVHDTIVRPHIGDVFVVILIYCFVRCFIPTGVRFLPLYGNNSAHHSNLGVQVCW